MHNMVYLIGRLTEDPTIKDEESNYLPINLAVQRAYKNEDGVYETDYLRCVMWDGIATNTCEYCKKGDLVGIKGRLQNRSYEDETTKEKKYITEVIVDKISFLASKKEKNEEVEV